MKGITVKLPDTTLRRLRQEARTTGRSVGALIRERRIQNGWNFGVDATIRGLKAGC